jgi:hypothetical protein
MIHTRAHKDSERKDRKKKLCYYSIFYTFSQSGVAITPAAALKSVTVSSPSPQTNISAPPFPVLIIFYSAVSDSFVAALVLM